MSGSAHDYEVLILERHLDTFGHVNNATYLQLCEEARWQMTTDHGCGIDWMRTTGHGLIVLEAHIRYRRELHCREKVTIRSRIERAEGSVCTIRQTFLKEGRVRAAEANFVCAFFNTKTRSVEEPPEEFARAFHLGELEGIEAAPARRPPGSILFPPCQE